MPDDQLDELDDAVITKPEQNSEPVQEPFTEEPQTPEETPSVESEAAQEPQPSEEEAPAQEPEITNSEEEVSTEEYFQSLQQLTGVEVSSDEDIVSSLKELAELRQLKDADPFADYDPLVKDIAKATKAGVDINTYLNARSLDVEKMDDKSALFQKFKLDNADAFSRNEKFAKEKFEREYRAKYASVDKVLNEDDFDSLEEYQQALDDQEFIKESLRDDAVRAKQDLNKWQQENITIKEQDNQISPEEIQQRQQAYNEQVNSTLESTKGLEVPVGDEKFTFDIGSEGKDFIREGLADPEKALKEVFGVDLANGQVNTDKMRDALVLVKAFQDKKLGEQLKRFAIEKYNKETLKGQQENPRDVSSLGSVPDSKSEDELVAEAFAEKRKF